MVRKSHLFEQWITDLPISGRPARLMVGSGAEGRGQSERELRWRRYGQKKEPTDLKGMLRISVEGRWARDREKITSLRGDN